MTVSIIICTCNRAKYLCETLRSLASIETPRGAELVVVDNASEDETSRVVKGSELDNMPVRYIYAPKRGLSNARNAGLAAARGDIVVFTDDDLRFPQGWLKEICRPIVSGEADAVSGGVRLAPHLERDWMTPVHRAWLADTSNANPYMQGSLVGANMAFRKDVLLKVPGFDPELGAGALGFGEDGLFSGQLQQAGYRVAFARDVVVEHHFQEDRLLRGSLIATAIKHGRTAAYMTYHWEHGRIRAPRLQVLRKLFQLALWRRMHGRECRRQEGMHPTEMHHLRSLHLYRHYLVECRRNRRYEKYGLVALNQANVPPLGRGECLSH